NPIHPAARLSVGEPDVSGAPGRPFTHLGRAPHRGQFDGAGDRVRRPDYTEALPATSMVPSEISRQTSPSVVAHRGASLAYPENTVEAFEGAIAAGADVVELDVRLTADGVPVILHDLDVGATTDGTGFVHTWTLADVKRLDASGGRGSRAEVPTLREA